MRKNGAECADREGKERVCGLTAAQASHRAGKGRTRMGDGKGAPVWADGDASIVQEKAGQATAAAVHEGHTSNIISMLVT